MSLVSTCCLAALALASTAALGDAAEPPVAPITISPDGVLLRDGVPYQGIGVNYFNLFARTLANPDDTSYEQGLAELAARDIPFVRFMAAGFWPRDWTLYREDPDGYFARLDAVVQAAERHGIGLIPSLFWHSPTVPDLVGEPIDQWGNPASQTIAFMRRYTQQVVTRYRHSPAIWAWEFANEVNLGTNLPNADEHRPPVWPDLGTPAQRTKRDEMTVEMLEVALREFGATVRELDPLRPITSGNSLPRPSAWHSHREGTWTTDSVAQFAEMLLRLNPDPINLIQVHVYPTEHGEYFADRPTDEAGVIAVAQQVAAAAGKALFVGEFGVPYTEDEAADRAKYGALVAGIRQAAVPLAAIWVFDLAQQDREWNIRWDNDRSWMLTP